MNEATRQKLMGVSVATLATALYKRGLRNQVIQEVHPVAPKGRNMVGPAFTLRYMPAREDRNQLAEFRKPDHPQRAAIEACPSGHVMVSTAVYGLLALPSACHAVQPVPPRPGATEVWCP